MTSETFGFTKIDTTEHEFARLLRRHKAINNHQTIGRSNSRALHLHWHRRVGLRLLAPYRSGDMNERIGFDDDRRE